MNMTDVANKYKAMLVFHDGDAIFFYPELGQGSAIMADLEPLVSDSQRMVLCPTERALVIEAKEI